MAEKLEELFSLLVPLNEARLLVPRACVAEVVRYSQPDRRPDLPAWFRGLIRWNEARIPVVWFEELCGLKPTEPGGRTRIVVFNAISKTLATGFLGIIAEGFPQMVRINRDVIELDDEYKVGTDSPVICQVRMINEQALVPDLEKLESMIQQHLGERA